jgi:hypothetical protein
VVAGYGVRELNNQHSQAGFFMKYLVPASYVNQAFLFHYTKNEGWMQESRDVFVPLDSLKSILD